MKNKVKYAAVFLFIIAALCLTLTGCKKEPIYFNVVFSAENAVGNAPETMVLKANENFILPENTFSRNGYTFSGWYDGSEVFQPGDNYTMPAKNVTFCVMWQGDFTVSLNNESVVYSGIQQIPTVKVYYADQLLTSNDYDIDYGSGEYTNVGDYTINVSGKGDYAGRTDKATFSITKKIVTVTVENKEVTYGESLILNPDTDCIVDGLIGNHVLDVRLTTNYEVGCGIDTYAIRADATDSSGNYELNFVEGELEVLPRAITITILDQEIMSGDEMDTALGSAFTYDESGLVAGDETALSVALSTAYNAANFDDGNFEISAVFGGEKAPNYRAVIVGESHTARGMLTVKPAYSVTVDVTDTRLTMGLYYKGYDMSEKIIEPAIIVTPNTGFDETDYAVVSENEEIATANGTTITALSEGVASIGVNIAIKKNGKPTGITKIYDTFEVNIVDYSGYNKVGTVAEFKAMNPAEGEKHVLVADIDFSSASGAAGLTTYVVGGDFNAELDGNGHSVRNVKFSQNTVGQSFGGSIFETLGSAGVIRNISFTNLQLLNAGCAGIVTNSRGRMENIYVSGTHIGGKTGAWSNNLPGVLAGRVYPTASFENCLAKITVSGDAANTERVGFLIGNIMGVPTKAQLINCYVSVGNVPDARAIGYFQSGEVEFNNLDNIYAVGKEFDELNIPTEDSNGSAIWNTDFWDIVNYQPIKKRPKLYLLSGKTAQDPLYLAQALGGDLSAYILLTVDAEVTYNTGTQPGITVDKDGVASFTAEGPFTVDVAVGNMVRTMHLSVRDTKLDLISAPTTVLIGASASAQIEILNPVKGILSDIEWESSDSRILSVTPDSTDSQSAILTGVEGKGGTVTVTAKYMGGITKSFSVTVYNPVSSVAEFKAMQSGNKDNIYYYMLTADIDFEYKNVTTSNIITADFYSVLDGNGCAVKNIQTIKDTKHNSGNQAAGAVFTTLHTTGIIRNITFTGFRLSNTVNSGIVANVRGRMENIFVQMEHIGGSTTTGGWYDATPGVIAAKAYATARFANCVAEVTLTSEAMNLYRVGYIVGSIVEKPQAVQFINCYASVKQYDENEQLVSLQFNNGMTGAKESPENVFYPDLKPIGFFKAGETEFKSFENTFAIADDLSDLAIGEENMKSLPGRWDSDIWTVDGTTGIPVMNKGNKTEI